MRSGRNPLTVHLVEKSALVIGLLTRSVAPGRAKLIPSLHAGIIAGMGALRKITVEVPESDLDAAQALTGEGVTETVRAALKKLAQIKIQNEFRQLRGTVKFSMTVDELRHDDE